MITPLTPGYVLFRHSIITLVIRVKDKHPAYHLSGNKHHFKQLIHKTLIINRSEPSVQSVIDGVGIIYCSAGEELNVADQQCSSELYTTLQTS